MLSTNGAAATSGQQGWHGEQAAGHGRRFVGRMIAAARLDPGLYEEVEADRTALPQAIAVVILASVAAGIGNIPRGGATGILTGTVAALVSWFVWALLVYFIGARLTPEAQTQADYGQLLRTMGFSSAPGLIRVFGLVPFLGPAVFAIAAVWMLVAMVIAVRQALDYTSTWRALGVVIIGWLVQAVILALLIIMATPV